MTDYDSWDLDPQRGKRYSLDGTTESISEVRRRGARRARHRCLFEVKSVLGYGFRYATILDASPVGSANIPDEFHRSKKERMQAGKGKVHG